MPSKKSRNIAKSQYQRDFVSITWLVRLVNGFAKELRGTSVHKLICAAKHFVVSALLETQRWCRLAWERQPNGRQLLQVTVEDADARSTVHVPFEKLSVRAKIVVINQIGPMPRRS